MLSFMRQATRIIGFLFLATLIVTPLLQIVMRGIFNVPMAGAEELARYFLICMTFLGGAYVTWQGGQIRMEEVQGMLPERPRWLLQLLIELSGVIFFAYMSVAAFVSISNNLSNQTATLEMPFWLFMGPMAVGMALLSIETFAQFIRTLRNRKADEKSTTLT
ncbi:TRAP transporter small permease [Rhizobiales bacterium TNE-4]|nr:TRAP transporter small permease [Rhizobiales bacterium TNE-4]MBV1826463.1 TRAP transporter small permease [Rhizobiales bacterium TNE-4]